MSVSFQNAAARVRAPTFNAFVIGLVKTVYDMNFMATHTLTGKNKKENGDGEDEGQKEPLPITHVKSAICKIL